MKQEAGKDADLWREADNEAKKLDALIQEARGEFDAFDV
jgi:hypothetical protein